MPVTCPLTSFLRDECVTIPSSPFSPIKPPVPETLSSESVPYIFPLLISSTYVITPSFLPKMPPAPPASAATSPSFRITNISVSVPVISLRLSPTTPPT